MTGPYDPAMISEPLPTLVRFTLKMNRFYSGGAGEARLIVERRAKALVRAGALVGVRNDALVLATALRGATPWEKQALRARAVGALSSPT
mgnify:CR=1 FL=1